MDRYTVHESKRTTATHGRSVWSGLAIAHRAPALSARRRTTTYSQSALADSLPPLFGCVGLFAHTHPRGSSSFGPERTSPCRGSSTAHSNGNRSSGIAPGSDRTHCYGHRAVAIGSAVSRELSSRFFRGKAEQTSQIDSSRRCPTQGSRGRFPALLSTSGSQR